MQNDVSVRNDNGEMIASRIREMRELMDMSAADVAEKLGVDEATYLSYEAGNRTLPVSTIYALAGIFGVDSTITISPISAFGSTLRAFSSSTSVRSSTTESTTSFSA